MSSPAPSGKPDFQPVESSPEPQENVQIAKAEPIRGKGPSKPSGKPSKPGKGKPNRAPEQTAALTPPEPTTPMAAPETSTASLAPTVFDANQRNIIQSYYQNTRSSSPSKSKSRGKPSRGSKRNKTGSVARNEILPQPTKPLPRALESQLPPAPPNTQRAVYNQQVVLLERGTNRVLAAELPAAAGSGASPGCVTSSLRMRQLSCRWRMHGKCTPDFWTRPVRRTA